MGAQWFDQGVGQNGSAIFLSFASTNDDLTAIHVNVFHSQVQRLEQAQARAIQDRTDQPNGTVEAGQQIAHFFAPQHYWHVLRPFSVNQIPQPLQLAPQHLLI